MASRLQQFATRNHKEGIEPKAGRYTGFHRAGKPRQARGEATLLDTDVESIGNTTTLSFADLDEDPDRIDADSDLRANPVFVARNEANHGWPYKIRSGARKPARSGWHKGDVSAESQDQVDEPEAQVTARLDEISLLPDSSRDQQSEGDRSPSPLERDPDITPRRKQAQRQDPASPLGTFKQHLRQSSSPAPPPFQLQPQPQPPPPPSPPPRTLPMLHSLEHHPPSDTSLLDYPTTTLGQIPYSQLATEPFETDPRREVDGNAPADTEEFNTATIAERLRVIMFRNSEADANENDEEVVDTDDDAAKHARLTALFSQLPLEQYEMAGDVILEQFGAVFGRFQDIRRRKRAVARAFEQKVAEREALVQDKQGDLDRSAAYLKKQGEDFMRGGPSGQ